MMSEVDYLKHKIDDIEKAFDKLHQRHMTLLKEQGELERENERLIIENTKLKGMITELKEINYIRSKKIFIMERGIDQLFNKKEQFDFHNFVDLETRRSEFFEKDTAVIDDERETI